MKVAKCRSVAKKMVEILIPPETLDAIPSALPIAFAFALGLLMVNTGAEPVKEVIEGESKKTLVPHIVFGSTLDGSILEDYFFSVLIHSDSQPEKSLRQFQASFDELTNPVLVRKLLRAALKDKQLIDRPGRPPKITSEDWPVLLQKSEALLPLCTAILRLLRTAKMRGIQAHLEFLRLDYPDDVAFLMEHLPKVEAVMIDVALLEHIKTTRTRAAKLADIFAGFAFALSPQYAMQQALAARRSSGLSESEEN